jgi:type IV secretion system protein VirB10
VALFDHTPTDGPQRHQAIRQGASNSISQTGQQIVQRQLNIQPTLTVRPGFPVRVIVTRDLLLTPYGQGGPP